ncbi:MBL fold metallo-hydrolase, partial [Nanoarchaeota archaeon]
MPIEITAVGGYGEVGKNMTAIKVDDEVVILDMGIHLPNYIRHTEQEEGDVTRHSAKKLIDVHAIPDPSLIDDWKKKVVAILPGHAHLDHIGAIPYLAGRYNCPIYCTPFTSEVLKRILSDEKINIPNKINSISLNGKVKLSPNISAEFIGITHSTPHTALIVLHTKYGAVLYCTDYKLDNSPILGRKPNYEKLRKLNAKVAILDSLYASKHGKTPSEFIARELLREVMLGSDFKGKGMFVTTFSSHIARVKSIIEFGKKLNRKIVFLGRSLAKYSLSAASAGIMTYDEIEIAKYGSQAQKALKKVEKN